MAQGKAPGTPGRFRVLINDRPLRATFGTVGAQWHWQDGGEVELAKGEQRLALHDLTGFEGRCDAVLFSGDPRFVPPNSDPEMAAFRRSCLGLPEQPEQAGEYDLVVTGGGIAGTCAAVTAARLGLKVALIQDRPVLGGNNSSEVRVWLQGARSKEPWPGPTSTCRRRTGWAPATCGMCASARTPGPSTRRPGKPARSFPSRVVRGRST